MAVGKIRKILYLVPDAVFSNYNDEVVEWLDARAQPDQAQINAVTDQQVLDSEAEKDADRVLSKDRKDILIFEINFDIENRLRVLESRPAVTKQQYKDALINIYKTL